MPKSVIQFNDYLQSLPHKIKIVIGGNHEIGFNNFTKEFIQQNVITNAIYLQDESLQVNLPDKRSLLFYGTPWTTSNNMGFSMSRSIISQKWDKIPENTDVLITHLPPQGYLDLATGTTPDACKICDIPIHRYKRHWGCPKLTERTKHLCAHGRLKVHLFGHVHEEWGKKEVDISGKKLLYCNGAAEWGDRARDPHVICIPV
jgi:Icc-related predicted phosphoesterase